MDELLQRYLDLCRTVVFDSTTFPLEWFQLACDLDKEGRTALAENCRSRGEYYGRLRAGQYQRIQRNVSFVDIVAV